MKPTETVNLYVNAGSATEWIAPFPLALLSADMRVNATSAAVPAYAYGWLSLTTMPSGGFGDGTTDRIVTGIWAAANTGEVAAENVFADLHNLKIAAHQTVYFGLVVDGAGATATAEITIHYERS